MGGNKTGKRVEIEGPGPVTTDKQDEQAKECVERKKDAREKSEAIAEFSVCCSPPT